VPPFLILQEISLSNFPRKEVSSIGYCISSEFSVRKVVEK